MPSPWFDEILTPEEREECEVAVEGINRSLFVFGVVCEHITEVIDVRMGDGQGQT